MSKRPKTAGSFLSRLRRPASRLRDMPIWSKLGLIMIVPTIATVVVGTSGLVDHLGTLNNANRTGDLANLIGYSGDLIDTLQDERATAVLWLGATREGLSRAEKVQTVAQYQEAFNRTNSRVDQARSPYSRERSGIDNLPKNFEKILDDIDESLANLPATRSQINNGKLKIDEARQSYAGLIDNLLKIRESAIQLAGDNDLSDLMRAGAAVARQKEYMAQRRVVVHWALVQGELNPNLRQQYIATETGATQAFQSFKAVATQTDYEFYNSTVEGSDLREAQSYWSIINSTIDGKNIPKLLKPDQWDGAMVNYTKLVRTVEKRLDRNVVQQAQNLRSDTQRQVFLETGLLLVMLVLAIIFAYVVARSMARSLRELRQGALSVAQFGLPQAVARLRDPQVTGQLTPVQLANQIAEPLPVRSRDEFGQVTEAFNAVHLEAVRTAAEQAALRASVATMFVNLARRSQILVDRLIGHLDRLERGEEDPDRLAELFQLDHLATRMRRNDENLLVLAGADSTRVQREPAALIDVLRAAQSEVEHYTRIEFGVIDRDIEVAAHAVNDLVHLVAELFDNATAFSPPDSHVMVEARRMGDRASLFVEDRGIGISPDQLRELNERLATPPQVDVAVSRMMGLVVVARLASRHGVKVELRPGIDRGMVADVSLPTSVLMPRALSGRGQQAPALPAAAAGPQQGGPAPAFGALAALGNGPSTPTAPRPGASGNQVTLGGRPFDPAPSNGFGNPATAGGTRSMPAWSDLTGATGPTGTGGDAFAPRTANGQPIDPLPQRRSPAEGDPSTGQQPAVPRQLPSNPEARPYSAPPAPPVSAPPLPPISGVPVSASPVSGLPVSGQPVSAAPAPAYPVSGPPVSQVPPRPAPPAVTPSVGAPPAWPPVATPDPAAAPPVPERLAAGLDMTTELPRVTRPEAPPAASRPAPAQVPAPRPAPPQQAANRFADETMELPIFRELESAWFRTRRPGPEEAAGAQATAASAAATQQFAKVDGTGRPVQQTTPGTTGNTPMAHTPTAGGAPQDSTRANGGGRPGYAEALPNRRAPQQSTGWQTAADDGWRAASAATEVPVAETTQKGLPKRVPMAQLVPGGVEKPTASKERRTPEGVRGLLSAYHRGVQRGRNHPTDSNSAGPEATLGGQQSSQSGSGPVAGSGQKEQQG
ncbi:nitrate- and nitrite sensing domain-containing protein [Micromonospora sp. SL4-19]|uniref:sensor histidine kinase n=1 Tax=Micromonospora sp. SL4-19 TaxID=3399129 RepID=UPI003A4E23B2